MSFIICRISPTALVVSSILASSSFSSFKSHAAEVENKEQNIERVSVVGSRIAAPSNTQTVEIDPSKYQSLLETLAQQPSVQINNNSGAGSVNELFLRGADSNYGLVLFNGIPLNDGTNTRGGVANLSGLNSLLVDRVEISHGAKSSVYGSQAVAGVVNFVTETKDGSDTSYTMQAGADGHSGYSAGLTAEFSELTLSVVSQAAPESYEGSVLESNSVAAVYQPSLSSGDLTVTLLTNNAGAEAFPDNSGGGNFAVNRELEQRQKNDFNLGLSYSTQLAGTNITVQGYSQSLTEDIDTPFVVPKEFAPATVSENELQRNNITAYGQRSFEGVTVLAGFDHTDETGSSEGIMFDVAVPISEDMVINIDIPTDFELSRATTGVFVEADVELIDNVTLHLAGRYDDADSESVFTPSSRLTWLTSNDQTISFEWGKGFKLPSFYALSSPLVGDPNLESEESETIQVHLTQTFEWGQMHVSAFNYEFTNLIDFDFSTFKLVNRSESKSEGLELSLSSNKTSKDIYWQASFTYTDVTTDGGEQMLGRAKHKANISLSKPMFKSDIVLAVTLDYKSGIWGESMPTGRVELDDMWDLAVSSEWQVTPELQINAGVKNLADSTLEYSPGNTHKGVMPWASFTYSF